MAGPAKHLRRHRSPLDHLGQAPAVVVQRRGQFADLVFGEIRRQRFRLAALARRAQTRGEFRSETASRCEKNSGRAAAGARPDQRFEIVADAWLAAGEANDAGPESVQLADCL